jgi:dTDP-4-dehydrorhamnose reductase
MDNLEDLKGTVVVANKGLSSKKELAEEIIKFYGADVKVEYTERKEEYKKDSYLEGQLRDWREALRECLCDRESLHQN